MTAMAFGLYQYKQLPQGISISPDVAQEAMENLLCEFLDCIVCYFSDIALFTHHVGLINKVCTMIEQAGFKANPNKCGWAKQQVGYLITLDGFKPLHSKINANLATKKPENLKQL